MPETEPVGNSQEFIDSYLVRVGAINADVNYEPVPLSLVEQLVDVEKARKNWVQTCREAAEAEEQFIELMGHPSHKPTKEAEVESHGVTKSSLGRRVEPEYFGYGSTLAAHRAAKAEHVLREICFETDKEIQANSANTSVAKAVMRAVLRADYPANPAQRNSLEYAAVAFDLIEAAHERADGPLIMVRRRWNSPRSFGNKPMEYDMSDLLFSEKFEIQPSANHELQLVLRGVKQVVFEEFMTKWIGGRDGVIGSSHPESDWHPVEKKTMTVQEHEELRVMDLMSSDQIKSTVAASFPWLRELITDKPDAFHELGEFNEPFSFGSLKSEGNVTGLFVAQNSDLKDLIPPDVSGENHHLFNNDFRTGLRDAQKVMLDSIDPSRRTATRRMRFMLR